MQRRVVSLWFPKLASERVLRTQPILDSFAITTFEKNSERIYCLNQKAEAAGLYVGMACADARAFCPDLTTQTLDKFAHARFLNALARWANRFCPWVGMDSNHSLFLNITGSGHLWGGEAAMLDDMRARLERAGLTVQIGLADTRGAAWALSRYGEGIAAENKTQDAIENLPIAALQLSEQDCISLKRLGFSRIIDLINTPRAPLARRTGMHVLKRLDQALDQQPEEMFSQSETTNYATRLTLPEPIGLVKDVMAGLEKLLRALCHKLSRYDMGARALQFGCRRVDHQDQSIVLRLSRPLRDPMRILSLFERDVEKIDAGFGIDQMRIEAVVESLPAEQLSYSQMSKQNNAIDDLITRIGVRIGLDNITRFLPSDSHIPEQSFQCLPAAYSQPCGTWTNDHSRPAKLFPPEAICVHGASPPRKFSWRRMQFTTGQATGPERISPQWWHVDDTWRSGLRDYWKIDTHQGYRLWVFHTPQNPGWFVQGQFV